MSIWQPTRQPDDSIQPPQLNNYYDVTSIGINRTRLRPELGIASTTEPKLFNPVVAATLPADELNGEVVAALKELRSLQILLLRNAGIGSGIANQALLDAQRQFPRVNVALQYQWMAD